MLFRTCKFCGLTKPVDKFEKDRRADQGRTNKCYTCKNTANHAWAIAHPEKNRSVKQASQRRRYSIEKRRRGYDAPGYRELQRQRARERRRKNPERHRIDAKERKRHIRLRTPTWLSTDEKQQVRNLYRKAQELTEQTGTSYHVDHIIPLRGKFVNGLHVPWNLQVLEASVNQRKQATFYPTSIVGQPR